MCGFNFSISWQNSLLSHQIKWDIHLGAVHKAADGGFVTT